MPHLPLSVFSFVCILCCIWQSAFFATFVKLFISFLYLSVSLLAVDGDGHCRDCKLTAVYMVYIESKLLCKYQYIGNQTNFESHSN